MTRGLMPFQVNEYLTKKIIQNLVIECTNTTQVVVKSGSVAGMDDGSLVVDLASDLTLDITVSGKNGLDTGIEASNTWYYVWLIYDPATQEIAGLLSASVASPTLPSGFTKKRLVGAVRNDGSSDFIRFKQCGNLFSYSGNIGVFCSAVNVSLFPGGTSFDVSGSVPVALSQQVFVTVQAARVSSGTTPTGIYTSAYSTNYRRCVDCPGVNTDVNTATQQQYLDGSTIYLGKIVANNVIVYAYIAAFFLDL